MFQSPVASERLGSHSCDMKTNVTKTHECLLFELITSTEFDDPACVEKVLIKEFDDSAFDPLIESNVCSNGCSDVKPKTSLTFLWNSSTVSSQTKCWVPPHASVCTWLPDTWTSSFEFVLFFIYKHSFVKLPWSAVTRLWRRQTEEKKKLTGSKNSSSFFIFPLIG